jgi:AcrR family transcriptional regulator
LASSKVLEKPLSRRDAHKHRTTTILRDSAFDLFLAQGYDATTTDQVAAKAGVSTRTFFRYFDSKDEVLFRGQRFWSEKVADMVTEQSAELNPMDAMCETLVDLATGVSREALVRYELIIKSSVSLVGRAQVELFDNIRRIAEGLAARRGLSEPDDESRIMASVGLMLYREAVAELRDGRKATSVGPLIREKFALLEKVYVGVVAQRKSGG